MAWCREPVGKLIDDWDEFVNGLSDQRNWD
jgi:hypothetical protein